MKKLFSLTPLAFLATCLILVQSCKPDDNEPQYDVPTTYNFTNVNYSGQTTRLDMMGELLTYIKSANAGGVVLDAQKMKDMFANENSQFTDAALNTSGKQLKNKCFPTDVAYYESLFDAAAVASQSTNPGSNGVAGIVTSTTDATKKYLQSENGFEYAQIIEKGLMGAIIYYQAVGHYLTEDEVGDAVDNTTVTPGEGTPMEHHWDEAFGYFGVPIDFPGTTTGSRYWGKYSNEMDAVLQTNVVMMNAFLKGRAAISNKDMETKNEQISIISQNWERIAAGTAIHYLNEAKEAIGNDAVRNHTLSECLGFLKALQYNPNKIITSAELQQVIDHIGDNFYEVTLTDLDNARNLLSTIYGMDDIKDTL
ncbi:MAG: hypothetical protein POELPBGB_02486 [Bacteroidia bacterium]|nr:hypothetical protein [Bacteroidia bacterium]